MVGNVVISTRRPAQLDGFFEDALEVGKNVFDDWVIGRGKTEEKALLEAQVAAQKAQTEQILNILKYGLVAAAVVVGVKYVAGGR